MTNQLYLNATLYRNTFFQIHNMQGDSKATGDPLIPEKGKIKHVNTSASNKCRGLQLEKLALDTI